MSHGVPPPREILTCLNNVNLTESSCCISTSQINFIKSIQRRDYLYLNAVNRGQIDGWYYLGLALTYRLIF